MDGDPHILIIDDDTRIRELLQSYLSQKGLRVSAAANAEKARKIMHGVAFDLLILDIMMPGESGLELARSLRDSHNGVPILMLSALSDAGDRIAGLTSGGDDYLAKPFEPEELLLRIRSILKRNAQPIVAGDARFGDCEFNVQRGELRRAGEVVRLTTRERDLLRLLVQRAGQTVSRLDLAIPGNEDSPRSIDVHINRLRRKLEPDPAVPVYLQTIRGVGYTLHLD